jgi:hypothetical protein
MIEFILGFAAASALFILAMRRAKKRPNGKTARAIEIAGGGGGPGVPDEN